LSDINDSDQFKEYMIVYDSKSKLIKNLFWKRIYESIKYGKITDHSKVLDVGCSSGNLLKTIRSQNSHCLCWGIDVEPDIKKINIKNCNFEVCSALKTHFEDNYFTTIFALDTLEHIKDTKIAIKELYRILSPNGRFILCGPTESLFYKLCRFLQFGMLSKSIKHNERGTGGEVDFHHHTIYDLEEFVLQENFQLIEQKSLPGFPIPELFRITCYKKIEKLS